jgi:hypothetical protein
VFVSSLVLFISITNQTRRKILSANKSCIYRSNELNLPNILNYWMNYDMSSKITFEFGPSRTKMVLLNTIQLVNLLIFKKMCRVSDGKLSLNCSCSKNVNNEKTFLKISTRRKLKISI